MTKRLAARGLPFLLAAAITCCAGSRSTTPAEPHPLGSQPTPLVQPDSIDASDSSDTVATLDATQGPEAESEDSAVAEVGRASPQERPDAAVLRPAALGSLLRAQLGGQSRTGQTKSKGDSPLRFSLQFNAAATQAEATLYWLAFNKTTIKQKVPVTCGECKLRAEGTTQRCPILGTLLADTHPTYNYASGTSLRCDVLLSSEESQPVRLKCKLAYTRWFELQP